MQVGGVRRTYYVLSALVPLLESLLEARVAPDVYLLPPLDNVLWDRERLADLFGFRYSWEIYLPPTKRRYGPYTMPVLDRSSAGATRQEPHRAWDRGKSW